MIHIKQRHDLIVARRSSRKWTGKGEGVGINFDRLAWFQVMHFDPGEKDAARVQKIRLEHLQRLRLIGHEYQKPSGNRSEEHTSELQSPCNLVCRLLLEKKKTKINNKKKRT